MAFILYNNGVACDHRASGLGLARAARLDVIALVALAEKRGILTLFGGRR